MTGCQEYLLKIKLGEMNSIWRAHIWRAKGREAETVEFWPGNRKPCSDSGAPSRDWLMDRITLTSSQTASEICFQTDMIIV